MHTSMLLRGALTESFASYVEIKQRKQVNNIFNNKLPANKKGTKKRRKLKKPK